MSARRRDNRWLTLGEASRLLGVHRATLRAWADAGQVKSFRTPGGHRRFLACEIEALIRGAGERSVPAVADRFAQHLLARARQDLSALTHAGNAWLDVFPDDVRADWRQSGRRLVGLAIQYVSRRQARDTVLDEGRAIGARYGRGCAERGLGLAGTVRAFLFFRESLLRATRPGLIERGQYDDEDARIHREMREFLDEVLFAMLDALEQPPRYLAAGGR